MRKKLAIWGGTFLVAVLCSLTPTDTPAVGAQAQAQPPPDIAYTLDHAADANGLSRRFLRCVALGESTFRPWVTGDYGKAHGLMQFHWGTWNANAPRYGFAGYSPYHAWAAAHVAAGMIRDGGRGHWTVARWCGSEWW